MQLGIYAIGARRAWGLQNGRATLYFVAYDKTESVPFDAFDEDKILNTFIEIGKKIEVNDFEPNLSHCAQCPFNTRCEHSALAKQTQE